MRFLFYLTLLILSLPLLATLNDVDKAMIFPKSILKNGGFENGKADWTTSSGSFSITSAGSNLLTGKVSALWDASAASVTLSSGAVTVPNGLKGKNGVAVIKTMVPSGTATHKFEVWDGSSVLGTMTIASSTIPTYQYLNFIMPGSGTIKPQLVSTADEPMIVLDDVWLGDAQEINLTNISQAQLIGSGYFAATTNCTGWSRTNNAIGAFSSDADCPAPTIEHNPGPGTLSTTDYDLPKFGVTNLPPGYYEIEWIFTSTTGGSGLEVFQMTDGSITTGNGQGPSSTTNALGFAKGIFVYTTAGSRTFELLGSVSGAGSMSIPNDANNRKVSFTLKRWPLQSEQAYKPSQIPFLWRGRHPQGCSWSMAATTISTITVGDASSCTLAEDVNVNAGTVASTFNGSLSLTPGIVWTPPKTGVFQVCANSIYQASTGMWMAQRLEVNGTNYSEAITSGHVSTAINETQGCAMFPVNTLGAITVVARYGVNSGTATINGSSTLTPNKTIDWSIIDLSNSLPSPLLTGSVTSTANSSASVNAGLINCDASSAITSQYGSWISSVGNVASGACTVTLTSNVYSTTPYCWANDTSANPLIVKASATGATTVVLDCDGNDGTDCTSYDANIFCIGAK